MHELTPLEIVEFLDKHIIGQEKAKKSVAIAMRNRWRRMRLAPQYRTEVTPKNILMIGPTGVGKTEIARRLAKMTEAPFIKVEATKFTEIGYVGKEVDSIIRDLSSIGMKLLREKKIKENYNNAKQKATKIIAEAIQNQYNEDNPKYCDYDTIIDSINNGLCDELIIEIPLVNSHESTNLEILTPPGMEDMATQLEEMFSKIGNNRPPKLTKISVKNALEKLIEQEASNLIDEKTIKEELINLVENQGIVFIDEIDKICENNSNNQSKVSREGVQRDLLPLIEGCSIKTKFGIIKTDHILFIASGAFQFSKPSDLIPELQGRLPIRVELHPLSVNDFERILKEPHASLTEQYIKLLETEGVSLHFTENGIKKIAQAAYDVNANTENIGARRLHTIMEKLLEDISFNAPSLKNQSIIIDEEYVSNHLDYIVEDEDSSRYIL